MNNPIVPSVADLFQFVFFGAATSAVIVVCGLALYRHTQRSGHELDP